MEKCPRWVDTNIPLKLRIQGVIAAMAVMMEAYYYCHLLA